MCLFVVFSFHLYRLVSEPNDSWWLFCSVVCCRTTIARRGCRIRGAYIRGNEKVSPQEKKHPRTSVLFHSLSVFVIENPSGRINDGTNYTKGVMLGIHDEVARTKILC
jgi:hypothetical protein